MTFERGDIIQLNGHTGFAVIVDIKWNGAELHVQWLNSTFHPQVYGLSYLKGMIETHNYKSVK